MVRRFFSIIGLCLGAALTAAALIWLWAERGWMSDEALAPREAFLHGTIGLETFPLKYAAVIEEVSGDAFATGLEDGRGMWETYGFIPGPGTGGAPACIANAADWTPVGVSVSSYVPAMGLQTPAQFAGLACAACHTARLRVNDGAGGFRFATHAGPGGDAGLIIGAGNQELDAIAWSDAIRNAVLSPDLTAAAVLDAYDARCAEFDAERGARKSWIGRRIEAVIIGAWISQAQSMIGGELAKYGLPHEGADMKDAEAIPAGPGRTRPFRSVVRVAMDLPAADNMAISKIPVVWEQDPALRPSSQYDGSIKDPVLRSTIAAYASGASPLALSKPEIEGNVRSAAAYTEALGLGGDPTPSFEDMFGPWYDAGRVADGHAIYRARCHNCHGSRPLDGGRWDIAGARYLGALAAVDEESRTALGLQSPPVYTDPARVRFRYTDMAPVGIWAAFPAEADFDAEDPYAAQLAQIATLERLSAEAEAEGAGARALFWLQRRDALELARRQFRRGHGLAFDLDELSAEPGYVNNPIPRAFLRAPYLHNGSIPTMRQLLNLDDRMDAFCRGENIYDPEVMGYLPPRPVNGVCANPRQSFLFDASAVGNSNRGHDFPWTREEVLADPDKTDQLESLMAYLRLL